jgi:AcrR family transcriptional regulator
MPRKPDPTIRPAILRKVVEHLRHTRLEDVSVRSLGRVLGTSAYPIVYHFGSRDALVDAVVDHLWATDAALDPDASECALADHLVRVFGGLDDPDRALAARLAFELGSVESLVGDDRHRARHREQIAVIAAWCRAHGYGACGAERAARTAVLTARGAQWDAVVDRDGSDTDRVLREVAERLSSPARASVA